MKKKEAQQMKNKQPSDSDPDGDNEKHVQFSDELDTSSEKLKESGDEEDADDSGTPPVGMDGETERRRSGKNRKSTHSRKGRKSTHSKKGRKSRSSGKRSPGTGSDEHASGSGSGSSDYGSAGSSGGSYWSGGSHESPHKYGKSSPSISSRLKSVFSRK